MDSPKLHIRPRKGGNAPSVHEDQMVLQGEQGWLLSGDSALLAAAEQTLGRLCERIGDSLLISFGNTVGRMTIPGIGPIEIVSGKWGEEHFDQMLADLSTIATALPFAADQPSGFPYDRSIMAQAHIHYHLFVYLRHILSPVAARHDRLIPALQSIVQQPHQRFEVVRRNVPLAAAQRVDQPGLLRIAAGVGGIARAVGTAAHTPIASVLRGYLPQSINEPQITHSIDTPENRFVKSFLQFVQGIIDGMRQTLTLSKNTPAFQTRLLDDCMQMEQSLAQFARHPLWAEVGTMVHVPAASTILHGRQGYRDVYRHFVRLRLAARIPLTDQAMRDLLEARDIAHLYEIWCFYAMVRALTAMLGAPQHAESPKATSFQMYVPHALAVTWPSGLRLRYNPHYVHGKGYGRSYSVPLRPDIALDIAGASPQTHLFDAKFRLDRLATILPAENTPQSEIDDEVVEERRGVFKRGDLYKMHTYRDALQGTGSVWVLYPGTESRFYSIAGERIDIATNMPTISAGVGAIGLRPEPAGDVALRNVLARLIGVIL